MEEEDLFRLVKALIMFLRMCRLAGRVSLDVHGGGVGERGACTRAGTRGGQKHQMHWSWSSSSL